MTRSNLPIDGKRLWEDVMALAAITEQDAPYTRRSFTPKFDEGRAFLRRRFEAAGLTVRIDTAGNMIGRREGTGPGRGTILIGSHSDSVPDGGRFDGAAGLLSALEVARALAERGVTLAHDLEVIDFLAEEVSAFRISCCGSRMMAGGMTPEMLANTGPGGETLKDAVRRVGGDPDRLEQASRSDIVACLELHIEQGRVLENASEDIGVVRTVVGIMRFALTVEGRADHAGTTPMHLREDALSGAVEVIRAIRDEARRRAEIGPGYFVATVGELTVEPGAANVVPRQVTIVVDVRAEHREDLHDFKRWMEMSLPPLAQAQRATLASVKQVSEALPAVFDASVCDEIRAAADSLGLKHRDMTSGAGHDATWVSRFAPTAMIFIPCRDGRSHTPDEWTEPDQLAAGAAVLLDAVVRIDRKLRG